MSALSLSICTHCGVLGPGSPVGPRCAWRCRCAWGGAGCSPSRPAGTRVPALRPDTASQHRRSAPRWVVPVSSTVSVQLGFWVLSCCSRPFCRSPRHVLAPCRLSHHSSAVEFETGNSWEENWAGEPGTWAPSQRVVRARRPWGSPWPRERGHGHRWGPARQEAPRGLAGRPALAWTSACGGV